MVEQVPVADGKFESLPLNLCHQPRRKSYGLHNILMRKQGGHWRRVIANSLLDTPAELPRWRWVDDEWPELWHRLRTSPIRDGMYLLVRNSFATMRDLWRSERAFMPAMAIATPLHHFLIGLALIRLRRERALPSAKSAR
jgi:hypothetical protein